MPIEAAVNMTLSVGSFAMNAREIRVGRRLRYLEAEPPASVRARGTLVLVHAFPLNARMWEPQQSLADGGWRVLAPQLRGFDGGANDTPVATMDDYAGDLVDLLDGLHVKDAVLGGLSMGGYVTLALVRLAPRYVRGLVLADTRPQADTPEGLDGRRRMLKRLDDGGPAAVADDMLPNLLGATTRAGRPEVAARVRELALANPPEAIAGAIAAMMARPDSTALLATVHCPTLVVVGDEDTVTPPSVSEDLRARIAGAELAVIRGAGHLSNLEQPALFNQALAGFLGHRV